jgi:hypothetical protein
VDAGTDFGIGAAAADVGHFAVDVRVRRLGILLQKRGRHHDLSGLAIAALRHLLFDPRDDHRMILVRNDALDCADLAPRERACSKHAGAHRLRVDMDGAGAAQTRAATKFRAGHSQRVAQDPEERCVRLRVHIEVLAVDLQRKHCSRLRDRLMGRTVMGKYITA